MNEKNNLISVIVPVYNGERFLAEALDSIVAQTFKPYEIVLIDDGSTDNSKAIALRYPEVKYTYQPNQGLAAALNLGISLAKGSYIAFLDADDFWVGEKLSAQMAYMLKDPELDIVFGHFQRLFSSEPDSDETTGNRENPKNESLPGFFKGTALIRKRAFLEVGMFDTSLKLGDFIDWFSRAKTVGLKMEMLPQIMLIRRVHENSKSYRQKDNRSDYIHIMKAALDRRRLKESQENSETDKKDNLNDR
jgi:glycosyltransferase involved in cell wall biosynthesis